MIVEYIAFHIDYELSLFTYLSIKDNTLNIGHIFASSLEKNRCVIWNSKNNNENNADIDNNIGLLKTNNNNNITFLRIFGLANVLNFVEGVPDTKNDIDNVCGDNSNHGNRKKFAEYNNTSNNYHGVKLKNDPTAN